MNIEKFKSEIEKTYKSHFPNSKVSVMSKSRLYNSIYIQCFLAGDKTENQGNYWDNDMMYIIFEIDSNGKELPENFESELPNELTFTSDRRWYYIKPDNKYNAYKSERI